jgi:DNA ligase-associated metallophosphoesterase
VGGKFGRIFKSGGMDVPDALTVEGAISVAVGGRQFWLLPEKAVWEPSKQRLYVADVHLGKAEHFQKSGLPLPVGADRDTLMRLAWVIGKVKASEVWILGDLFHSHENSSVEGWQKFRHALREVLFALVPGNHDVMSRKRYEELGLLVLNEKQEEEGWLFTHAPDVVRSKEEKPWTMVGHVHPGVRLRGKGKQVMRLPCFRIGEKEFWLPAFGKLTGSMEILPQKGDILAVIAGNKVLKMPVK